MLVITSKQDLEKSLAYYNTTLVVKFFNSSEPIHHEIAAAYNKHAKNVKYSRAKFAVFDINGIDDPSLYNGKLEGFPCFIVYSNAKPIAMYTGTSIETLQVIINKYL